MNKHICELKITDDMSELEKYVREQAMAYVDSTIFLSSINPSHPNIDNVVQKGKEVTPYVFKLFKENGEDSTSNMYTHFFLLVMEKLYEPEPFEGYVGIPMCVKYWLTKEKHGLLDKDIRNITIDNTKEYKDVLNFLFDLFNIKNNI